MHGRAYDSGRPIALSLDAGRIAAIDAIEEHADLPWIVPAFFDLQVNGALGVNFTSDSLATDEIRKVVEEQARHHVGAFLPTVITSRSETIKNSFAALARACEKDVSLSGAMPGFHLEGPYIAAEDGPRGAHPQAHVRDPDWDEFRRWQDAAGGRIRLVTLAPERPGALAFMEKLRAASVVVAIGHTAATPALVRDAVGAGATLSTHLGNGNHALLPRHENNLWEQMASDGLMASVIADGHHLPVALLKTIVRAKTPTRTILVSDLSPPAGLPPDRYRHWETDLDLSPSGRVSLAGTPYLAGSGTFLDACVAHVRAAAGVSLKEAVAMASVNPRRLMGLPQPRLEIGMAWEFAVVPAADSESKSAAG